MINKLIFNKNHLKQISVIILLFLTSIFVMTGCNAEHLGITDSNLTSQDNLKIYDVSVVTRSVVGQIKVASNPDRWETAEIGHVDISCKTNYPTRLSYECQVTESLPRGYNLGFSRSSSASDDVYLMSHQFSGDDLCPVITYRYVIFCTDQQGRQATHSGTFLAR